MYQLHISIYVNIVCVENVRIFAFYFVYSKYLSFFSIIWFLFDGWILIEISKLFNGLICWSGWVILLSFALYSLAWFWFFHSWSWFLTELCSRNIITFLFCSSCGGLRYKIELQTFRHSLFSFLILLHFQLHSVLFSPLVYHLNFKFPSIQPLLLLLKSSFSHLIKLLARK